MNGAQLTKSITTYLHENYTKVVINITGASKNGWPDLLACINGDLYGFEIKGIGDTEAELQKQKLDLLCKEGGYGGFVRSVQDVKNIIVQKLKYRYQPSITIKL